MRSSIARLKRAFDHASRQNKPKSACTYLGVRVEIKTTTRQRKEGSKLLSKFLKAHRLSLLLSLSSSRCCRRVVDSAREYGGDDTCEARVWICLSVATIVRDFDYVRMCAFGVVWMRVPSVYTGDYAVDDDDDIVGNVMMRHGGSLRGVMSRVRIKIIAGAW